MTKTQTLTPPIPQIQPLSPDWTRRAHNRLDQLTKPLGSLGRLEDLAAQLVAIQETDQPTVDGKAVYVFAADHGVTAEGVSAYPKCVTEQMVLNFLRGGAAINVLARQFSAELHVIDVGVDAEFDDAALLNSGLINRKVRRGSRNFRREPALSSDEFTAAWAVGVDLANKAHGLGRQLIALGEMGIGNTTSASAITAALTGQPAATVTGSGTGVTGKAFARKVNVIDDALHLHFPDYRGSLPSPFDVLRYLGGLEVTAMTSFLLTAAHHRIALLIDGFISSAAAAVAVRFEPNITQYLFAGHRSTEAGHAYLLDIIGAKPILDLSMRLGEASGAALAFPILDAAARIYRQMATFRSASVSDALR